MWLLCRKCWGKAFFLVTGGRGIGEADFKQVLKIYRMLRAKTSLALHASLGSIDQEKAW
ncbi:MAG: hypothetical protein STSR0004_09760 [Peptococcaceae bacterium]